MALSGSIKTNGYEGRYYQVDWKATQSVSGNTSTVSWTLKCAGGSASWYAERTLKVVLAGSTVYSKTDRVQRYTGKIASGTKTIAHDSSGAASFSISIQAAIYGSSVNCTGSSSFTLDTIPRKSTLSVANGTLNTAQTISVTRQSSSFTHTITATCGSASSTICTKSSSTSISFTPPLEWASQNTTGTTVSVTYQITTYNGSTSVGSNNYAKSCTIPTSVKPSCSINATDTTGYADTYGGFIKGISKFSVTVTPTTSYGSAIASYSTTANGATYTTASFTTGEIKTSGTLTINATVRDNRGRTGTASISKSVLDYNKPQITALSVKRCNSDGTENQTGEYVKAVFNAEITALNNKNTATYTIKYKKTSDTAYTSAVLSDYENQYSVTGASYIFAAGSGSSYDVKLEITDAFTSSKPVSRSTSVSTGFSIIHFNADGTGVAFGKISELPNTAEFGMMIKTFHGELMPCPVELEADADLDTIMDVGYYLIGNATVNPTIVNKPELSITATGLLEVFPGGDGEQRIQRLTQCDKDNQYVWQRCYYTDTWGAWQMIMGGVKNITFTPEDGVTLLRYSISRQCDIVTLYINMKKNAAISAGTDTQFGIIPSMFAPKNSVATCGIQGNTGTCVAWMRNDGSFWVRPGAAYTANSPIEVNLTWNITATF